MVSHGTDLHWEAWGRLDPYYGVVTSDQFRLENLEASKRDFFASGERKISEVLKRVDAHYPGSGRSRALDYGSGVGRLTLALAKRFDTVLGLDISQSMCKEAQKNAEAQSLANVSFKLADDRVSNADGSFDLVLTYVVVQHIRAERGYRIIENLLEKVRPNGVAAIHISVRYNGSFTRKMVQYLKNNVPFAYLFFNILQRKKTFEPVMEINNYDTFRVVSDLERKGFENILMFPERHGFNDSIWILAQRRGSDV